MEKIHNMKEINEYLKSESKNILYYLSSHSQNKYIILNLNISLLYTIIIYKFIQ